MSLFFIDSIGVGTKIQIPNLVYTTLQVQGRKNNQCPPYVTNEPMQYRSDKRRAFFLPFLSRGSLSVEAAIICPIIIGVFVLFCYLFIFLYQDALLKESLENTARRWAHIADGSYSAYSLKYQLMKPLPASMQDKTIFLGESDLNADDDWLDLKIYYQVEFLGLDLVKSKYYMADRARVRIWTGSDMFQMEQKVYITLNGTVYHTSRDCTYLTPQINKADVSTLDSLRNKNGETYQACKECYDKDIPNSGFVFVTEYGNRFHRSLNCTYLNHCILEVALSKVQDRKECRKCSKQ